LKIYTTNTEEGPKKGASLLLYGPPKSGKTYFLGQIPGILIFDCEGNTSSIKGSVPVVKLESQADINSMLTAVKAFSKTTDDTFHIGGHKISNVKALAIDTLDALSRLMMADILKLTGKEIPKFDEWNLVTNRVRNVFRTLIDLRDIGVHILFTAHEEIEKSSITDAVKGQPMILGKLPEELAGGVETLIHTSSRGGKYYLAGCQDGFFIGGDTAGIFPSKPVEATFSIVWPAIASRTKLNITPTANTERKE
jgi:AAA domain